MPRSTDPEKNPERSRSISEALEVRTNLLSAVAAAASNITPVNLQRYLLKEFQYDNRTVRVALRELIAEGELNYIDEAGRTTIELAFNRPVRVSERIFIVPAGHMQIDETDKVTVVIQQGAAFGDGRHPSTRLALMGIEAVVDDLFRSRNMAAASVLDIGTGSGVLLLAALRLGMGSGVGIDIDPCAVSEAGINIQLNGLAAKAAISHHGIDELARYFDLVCANLRWPTLKSMRNQIAERLQPLGAVVVAGINSTEMKKLIEWYARADFLCRWHASQDDWAAVVLQLADQ